MRSKINAQKNKAASKNHAHQKGIALITVLLIVAITTLLTVAMLRAQFMAAKFGAGLFGQDQALLYTQGAEDFVQDVLREDFQSDKRDEKMVDYPAEIWAKPFPSYPVDGGFIQARVMDLQSRFNLNRVWHDGAQDAEATEIFQRLLKNLDLPQTLAPALSDWLDADDSPTGSDGAEDDFYARLNPAYRSANQALVDISELRLIKGFTPEIIAKLEPYVCTLPAAAKININTASTAVINALSTTLSERTAGELSSNRPKNGYYRDVNEFLSLPNFNGLSAAQKAALQQQIDVRTYYFQLFADATIDGRHSVLRAVIARNDSGTLQIIARDFSQKFSAKSPNASAENSDTKNTSSNHSSDDAKEAL